MIVDANVFKGFYESEMGNAHTLSGCPIKLMSKCTPDTPIYHDVGRIIENEWQQVVDYDWFTTWLSVQLLAGKISYVEPKHDNELEKKMANVGFPKGRDIVYARVCLSVVDLKGQPCTLYTEDLDFYDPKQKKCTAKTRAKLLLAATGPICKILKKKKIHVSSV